MRVVTLRVFCNLSIALLFICVIVDVINYMADTVNKRLYTGSNNSQYLIHTARSNYSGPDHVTSKTIFIFSQHGNKVDFGEFRTSWANLSILTNETRRFKSSSLLYRVNIGEVKNKAVNGVSLF